MRVTTHFVITERRNGTSLFFGGFPRTETQPYMTANPMDALTFSTYEAAKQVITATDEWQSLGDGLFMIEELFQRSVNA